MWKFVDVRLVSEEVYISKQLYNKYLNYNICLRHRINKFNNLQQPSSVQHVHGPGGFGSRRPRLPGGGRKRRPRLPGGGRRGWHR